MIVERHPDEPWLDRSYRCPNCQAVVRMEQSDQRDSAWQKRRKPDGTYTIRARCCHCASATGWFIEVKDET